MLASKIMLLQWSPSQPLDVRSHNWSALYHYQESRHLLACSKKSVFFKLPQSQICHNQGQINQPSSAHTKDHSAYYTPLEAARRRNPEAMMELLASGGRKTLRAALRWTLQERRVKGPPQ
ncbi:unnamed protein product [Gulo gulo]|uniref:Uncharacterized protein n=1 Tax=Gulo gulo TaxID=48420 RepID=A0A9X9MAU2_GULGU|nr:unnamed protein product [Gulo gulo]